MTPLENALAEVAAALEDCELAYMLIGGLAVATMGEPRATLDVDILIWVDPDQIGRAVDCLCTKLRSLSQDPHRFVAERKVLPVVTSVDVRADLVFARLLVERVAIKRAVRKPLAGRLIPVVSVEDLRFMKLISERPKDLADAQGILRRAKGILDLDYLMPKLEEMAEALARPEIVESVRRELRR